MQNPPQKTWVPARIRQRQVRVAAQRHLMDCAFNFVWGVFGWLKPFSMEQKKETSWRMTLELRYRVTDHLHFIRHGRTLSVTSLQQKMPSKVSSTAVINWIRIDSWFQKREGGTDFHRWFSPVWNICSERTFQNCFYHLKKCWFLCGTLRCHMQLLLFMGMILRFGLQGCAWWLGSQAAWNLQGLLLS